MARRSILKTLTPDKCTFPNLGLWFDKFPTSLDHDNPGDFNRIFQEVADAKIIGPAYRLCFDNWKKALTEIGALVVKADASKTRLAVGLGNESALETSIAFNYTHGVPVIPGSALKGLAASFARKELDGWESDGEAYQQLFGFSSQDSSQQSGCVVFYDAWPDPDNGAMLHQDVINVHHKNYYQAEADVVESPPADWDDPVPIAFLTSSGKYWVAVSSESDEWSKAALDILRMALDEYGVGGKTSRGYGRMKLELPQAAAKAPQADLESLIVALTKLRLDKASFNSVHVSKWDKLPDGDVKKQFGEAILVKLRQLGWDKDWSGKEWLQKIRKYCE